MVVLSMLWKNSAGRHTVVPYTNSVALQSRPFLNAVRTPNNNIGSTFVHLSGIDWLFRAFNQTIRDGMVGSGLNPFGS